MIMMTTLTMTNLTDKLKFVTVYHVPKFDTNLFFLLTSDMVTKASPLQLNDFYA